MARVFIPDPKKKTRAEYIQKMITRLPPAAALEQIKKSLCERSLLKFVQEAWPYLDNGGSGFYSNWHLEAVCSHLQAVSRGEIRRLVFNLPPRSLKSILVSVAWPMWTWAQSEKTALTGPAVKFLCASYNQDLAWKLSSDSRRLVTSPFYQKFWGKSVILRGDQSTKTQFDITAGGSRFATSVGGSLLGIGGSIIICFPYGQQVLTEHGPRKIGDIVEGREKARIWSYNRKFNRCELQPVVGWHTNPGRRLITITADSGATITVTENHRLLFKDGYKEARDALVGDLLLTATSGMTFAAPPMGDNLETEVLPCLSRVDTIEWLHDIPSATYCLTVDQNHNMLVGSDNQYIVAANCDDLQNVSVSSETERETSIEWFKELSTTRFNDPKTGALVVVMQRLHNFDLTGYLQEHGGDEWSYVVIPMEFEPKMYQVPTPLGWLDPRGLDDDGNPVTGEELDSRKGWLLHPDRVPRIEVERLKEGLGPYLASGRLQQMPVPMGGAILKEEWWKLWDKDTFPVMGTVIASFDGAFTEKEENDPSALTVWGCFADETGAQRLMLMDAWDRRLSINELVQAVATTCKKHRVDTLLIESKASGHSAAQEIKRLYGSRAWQTLLINPRGDKVARVHAVVPFFSAGMIYAPDREYAQKVIAQASMFPKGAHDDLVDTCSQAISWLRTNGQFPTDEEFRAADLEAKTFRKTPGALYDI